MLLQLDHIKFPRSFKPDKVDTTIKPVFCSFNDGNPDAFGTVGYVRWTLLDGSKRCRIMLSKSRLGLSTHKGETVRNELSGATLSARLNISGTSEGQTIAKLPMKISGYPTAYPLIWISMIV